MIEKIMTLQQPHIRHNNRAHASKGRQICLNSENSLLEVLTYLQSGLILDSSCFLSSCNVMT